MAFGQSSGPPATARQLQELLELLNAAGHEDFRDARGPMGFTQRQAGGKFTRDEADALISQLQEAADAERVGGDDGAEPVVAEPAPRLSSTDRTLRALPTEQLAAELQRRGWAVVSP